MVSKGIGIGISDFKALRIRQNYYIDKTMYIKDIIDNPYLEKTVITGVSRVAKESIFSGANNFKVFTVLDNEFADDFGITEEEMDKVIEDFEV